MVRVRMVTGVGAVVVLVGLLGCTPESNVLFTNNTTTQIVINSVDRDGVRERVASLGASENLRTHIPLADGCSTRRFEITDATGALVKSVSGVCEGDTILVP